MPIRNEPCMDTIRTLRTALTELTQRIDTLEKAVRNKPLYIEATDIICNEDLCNYSDEIKLILIMSDASVKEINYIEQELTSNRYDSHDIYLVTKNYLLRDGINYDMYLYCGSFG